MAKLALLITLICSLHAIGADRDPNVEDFGDDDWIFFHEFVNSVDLLQENLSQKIYIFSSSLDHTLYSTLSSQTKKFESARDESAWYDWFFREDIYLDENIKSYARIVGGYRFDHLGASSFIQDATIRLNLPQTEKSLQFFVGVDEQSDDIDAERSDDVGFKYFLPTIVDNFKINASIGFAGFSYPYIKAYIKYPYRYQTLYIQAIEQIKYSHQDGYEESTSLYIDREIIAKRVLRVLLKRSSSYNKDGMYYQAALSLRRTVHNGAGLKIQIATYGKYTKDDNGLYGYEAKVTWKERLFRDYLYYQLEPSVEFQKRYNYKTNYMFTLFFELFFGKI